MSYLAIVCEASLLCWLGLALMQADMALLKRQIQRQQLFQTQQDLLRLATWLRADFEQSRSQKTLTVCHLTHPTCTAHLPVHVRLLLDVSRKNFSPSLLQIGEVIYFAKQRRRGPDCRYAVYRREDSSTDSMCLAEGLCAILFEGSQAPHNIQIHIHTPDYPHLILSLGLPNA